MDSVFMYAMSLVTVSVSVLIFILIHNKRSKESSNCPPGSSGLPFIGETISFALSGSEKFISDRMKKYSDDVFQTSLFGENIAILCGPQGNKFLFSNENRWLPNSMKRVLFLSDSDSAVDVLPSVTNLVHGFLKLETLKQYIPIMDTMAKQHIDKEWAIHQDVKIYPLSRKYTLDVACRLLFNVVDPVQVKKIGDPFQLMLKGMFSAPIDLPGTAYNGALKYKNMVNEQLLIIIKARRTDDATTAGGCDDFLSKLLVGTNQNGECLRDDEISIIIINMLVGSFHTVNSTLTFALKHLAEYPNIYDQALKEQNMIDNAKGPNDLLTWNDIAKMKYLWNVVRETLRVVPPTTGSLRETTTDCTYAGFKIPKGWKTIWNIHTTYNNPKYFRNPEKFDPTRFEGKGPAPYTFVPFGGGPRMCAGIDYSRLLIVIFLRNIVKRYKLESLIPDEKIAFGAYPVPVNGLPVRLHPTGMHSAHES